MDKCECINKGGRWKDNICNIDKKKMLKQLVKYAVAGVVLMFLLLFVNLITGQDLAYLTIFSVIIAVIILYISKGDRQLYLASGITAMVVDFIYEYIGTTINNKWSYVSNFMIPGTQVPVGVPITYLGLGIMFAAFVKYFDKWLD